MTSFPDHTAVSEKRSAKRVRRQWINQHIRFVKGRAFATTPFAPQAVAVPRLSVPLPRNGTLPNAPRCRRRHVFHVSSEENEIRRHRTASRRAFLLRLSIRHRHA
jgi:hypothetical protein